MVSQGRAAGGYRFSENLANIIIQNPGALRGSP
jgi:hypothetical protein